MLTLGKNDFEAVRLPKQHSAPMAPKSHRGAQPQTRPIKAGRSWQHSPKAQRYTPTHLQQSSIAEIEDCTLPMHSSQSTRQPPARQPCTAATLPTPRRTLCR